MGGNGTFIHSLSNVGILPPGYRKTNPGLCHSGYVKFAGEGLWCTLRRRGYRTGTAKMADIGAIPAEAKNDLKLSMVLRRHLKRLLKAPGLGTVRDLVSLLAGLVHFRWTGTTPRRAHQALVSLFCSTGGVSNDIIHKFVARRRYPFNIEGKGVLGVDEQQLHQITKTIRERGYYVFERRLPAEFCDRLQKFALTEQAHFTINGEPKLERYDRERPKAVRYDFSEKIILRSDAAQELMADPSVLAVAQAYLGCAPVLDLIACWWHTSWSQEPDKDAAQFFHFDMDRIKWLKFFFYITDVGPENGPHSFVAGSHRSRGIPESILKKGQVRIDDKDVLDFYSRKAVIEFCGPAGTIIAEDTRGLHKGKHVRTGDRLVFQLEFSDSVFGKVYPDPTAGFIPSSSLQQMAAAYPSVYSRFVKGNGAV